jgi:hypothetical protein
MHMYMLCTQLISTTWFKNGTHKYSTFQYVSTRTLSKRYFAKFMCVQGIDQPFERRSESSLNDPSFSYSVLKGHHLNFEWLWPVKVILKIISGVKRCFAWTIPLNVFVIYSIHEHWASNRLRAYFNLKINGSSWCIMTFVYISVRFQQDVRDECCEYFIHGI